MPTANPSLDATTLAGKRRLSVERINRHAESHGIAVSLVEIGAVDHSKLFTCPSLAPLAHSPIWHELSEVQQRRYNQLVGLMQNEWICFFEQEFAVRVLPALLKAERDMPADLVASLRQFIEDERQHTALFRALNRAAEPAWYEESDYHILRVPRWFRSVLERITRRPTWFPMVLWVMLLMEERSLMIGRRYAAMPVGQLDGQFAAAYLAHLEDEVRHVQLDWHLLERFYEARPAWLRRLNARLLEWFVTGLFLKPRRANVRLVDLLTEAHPELRPMRDRLVSAVRKLDQAAGYREMMYSADATPIGDSLFARLPEFAQLRRKLFQRPGGP